MNQLYIVETRYSDSLIYIFHSLNTITELYLVYVLKVLHLVIKLSVHNGGKSMQFWVHDATFLCVPQLDLTVLRRCIHNGSINYITKLGRFIPLCRIIQSGPKVS
jgi:hypothetical protein